MLSPALAFKEEIKAGQAVIIQAFKEHHKAEQLLHDLCRNVDHVLEKVWKHFQLPREYSLVAVGGYGRGELFPQSDVDVLILLHKAPEPAEKEKARKSGATVLGHRLRHWA